MNLRFLKGRQFLSVDLGLLISTAIRLCEISHRRLKVQIFVQRISDNVSGRGYHRKSVVFQTGVSVNLPIDAHWVRRMDEATSITRVVLHYSYSSRQCVFLHYYAQ